MSKKFSKVWNWKNWNRAMALSAVAGTTLIYSGCGKGPDAVTPPAVGVAPGSTISVPLGACALGQYPLPFGCAPAPDLQTACLTAGGYLNSQGICRVQFSLLQWQGLNPFMYQTLGYFPLLSPSNPLGYGAFDTGLQIYQNDLVTFDGWGGWGSTQTQVKKILGIFNVTTTTLNCNQVDLDGNSSGAVVSNAGMPAGLLGTDGIEVFPVGSHVQKRIAHNGRLKLGFNTPAFQAGCYDLSISNLYVTRCFSNGGATVACPF